MHFSRNDEYVSGPFPCFAFQLPSILSASVLSFVRFFQQQKIRIILLFTHDRWYRKSLNVLSGSEKDVSSHSSFGICLERFWLSTLQVLSLLNKTTVQKQLNEGARLCIVLLLTMLALSLWPWMLILRVRLSINLGIVNISMWLRVRQLAKKVEFYSAVSALSPMSESGINTPSETIPAISYYWWNAQSDRATLHSKSKTKGCGMD